MINYKLINNRYLKSTINTNSNNIKTLYAMWSKVNLYDKNLEYYNLVSDLLDNDIILKMKSIGKIE